LKDETQIPVPAAFEESVSQFANPKTAVHVRLAIVFHKVAKRQETLHSFTLWKVP
jgi:hypothetical protein